MLLSNKPVNGKLPAGAYNGQNWHTDLSYTMRPAKATMVYCIEKPSVGGDTMFANMYAAYEALSPRMRELLDDLEAVNDVSLISAHSEDEASPGDRRHESDGLRICRISTVRHQSGSSQTWFDVSNRSWCRSGHWRDGRHQYGRWSSPVIQGHSCVYDTPCNPA